MFGYRGKEDRRRERTKKLVEDGREEDYNEEKAGWDSMATVKTKR